MSDKKQKCSGNCASVDPALPGSALLAPAPLVCIAEHTNLRKLPPDARRLLPTELLFSLAFKELYSAGKFDELEDLLANCEHTGEDLDLQSPLL
jgi:hypothetical protein